MINFKMLKQAIIINSLENNRNEIEEKTNVNIVHIIESIAMFERSVI
jgi:hypothetical protein